jgi:hypothetical protein
MFEHWKKLVRIVREYLVNYDEPRTLYSPAATLPPWPASVQARRARAAARAIR